MRDNLARSLGLRPDQVSVKATTGEGIGIRRQGGRGCRVCGRAARKRRGGRPVMTEWLGELLSALTVWVSENGVWIAVLSVVYFLVSLFVIRYLIIRIPTDYFMDGPGIQRREGRTFVSLSVRIGKNLIGIS